MRLRDKKLEFYDGLFKRANPGLFLFVFVLCNNNFTEKFQTLVGFKLESLEYKGSRLTFLPPPQPNQECFTIQYLVFSIVGPHLHENPLRRGLLKVFPNLEMASIILSMKRWFCKCSRGGFCKIWCPQQGQVIVCQFRLGQLSNIFRKLHCKSGQVGSNLLNSVNRGFSNTCVLCCKEQGISRIKMKAMQAITSNFLLEQKENLLQSNNKF